MARTRLFRRIIRNRVKDSLMEERGLTEEQADKKMRQVDDALIDETADHHRLAAIGDGHIWQWIKLHGPEILKVIASIVAILMLFAGEPKNAEGTTKVRLQSGHGKRKTPKTKRKGLSSNSVRDGG